MVGRSKGIGQFKPQVRDKRCVEGVLQRACEALPLGFFKKEIEQMLASFSFTLRGRIQLDAFQDYMEVHEYLRELMYESPDFVNAGNPDMTTVTVFEKTAGEDDQERYFASRRNIKSTPRAVDAFLVDDEEAQRKVTTPSEDRSVVEAFRWDDWDKCYLLQENQDGTALVEWLNGGISEVTKENLRIPKQARRSVISTEAVSNLISSTVQHFVDAGNRARARHSPDSKEKRPRKEELIFRKHKLNTVPPLRDRMLQAAMLSNGNVSQALVPMVPIRASRFKHVFATRTVARLARLGRVRDSTAS
eukprot:TRINITY_DN1883_c0_g1_i1.p1 TRINITY_DN1883_c0_g1~~TRINITY_DN1883_c0_g1_i1.p1  ORF type:complete len:304 (+),score=74.66 TRINITY_DN1883_c0_g1_i1:202-1113(+)